MGRQRARTDIITITSAWSTDVGKVRGYNEDALLLADLTVPTRFADHRIARTDVGPLGMLFAVCDGMGGAAAGEIASALAVDELYEHLSAIDLPPENHDEIAKALTSAVEAANHRIYQDSSANPSRCGMGSTLTAALLHDNLLLIAQVGDSRAYVLRRGELTQVTEDQSLVNQLLASGDLIPEDLPTFKYTNVILQALGTSPEVFVELSYVELFDGDRILLCSDGLSGMLGPSTLATIVEMGEVPEETCSTLIQRANAAGGRDNITALVVHFHATHRDSPPQRATKVRYEKYLLPGEVNEIAWDTLAVESLRTVSEEGFFRGEHPVLTVPRRPLASDARFSTPREAHGSPASPPWELVYLLALFAFVFLALGVLAKILG